MPDAKLTSDFWFTEEGEVFCTACAREEGLSPDNPDSGLSEMTPECAWETNENLGDGFRLTCQRCDRVVPASPPPLPWRARCLHCGSVRYFAGRPEGTYYCPLCRIPRRVERNPRFTPA